MGTLQEWLELTGFYALLVLALLCLPLCMRHRRRRGQAPLPHPRKHRTPWRRP